MTTGRINQVTAFTAHKTSQVKHSHAAHRRPKARRIAVVSNPADGEPLQAKARHHQASSVALLTDSRSSPTIQKVTRTSASASRRTVHHASAPHVEPEL